MPFQGSLKDPVVRTAPANLAAGLKDHPRYLKLAQVHRYLIRRDLLSFQAFRDPSSADFERQLAAFVRMVRRYRPDLPAEIIEAAARGGPVRTDPEVSASLRIARSEPRGK